MRNWTEHGFSRLTAISDAGSTPAASTILRAAKDGSRICKPSTTGVSRFPRQVSEGRNRNGAFGRRWLCDADHFPISDDNSTFPRSIPA